MARHDDAAHVIRMDRDHNNVAFCTVCNRDLTEDEMQALREERA